MIGLGLHLLVFAVLFLAACFLFLLGTAFVVVAQREYRKAQDR